MIHRFVTCLCACIVLGSLGMFPAMSSGAQVVTVTGTGSSIGTMKLIADTFSRKHPGIRVDILPSIGSTGGIKAVQAGRLDVGLSSRALKPEEQDGHTGVIAYARTPVVFGAHANTAVNDITLEDVEQIYSGRKMSWPDKTAIRPVLRPRSDAYSEFLAGINGRIKDAVDTSYTVPGLFIGVTDQDAATQLERAVGSFGAASLAVIISENRNIKRLSVNKVAPTVKNLERGTYPYAMTMHLVYRKTGTNPAAKAFIDFIFSPDGVKILRATGHQPLKRPAGQ